MSRFAWGLLILFWSTLSYAQSIPTVVQWIDVFEKVRQHGLFADLNITYAKAPAANVGFSPVGVIPRDGVDCVIVIAEGDNPKMEQIMQLAATPAAARAFLLTLAAHEFGHCFRIRSKHLSRELWERVAATTAGSAERGVLEKLLSIEEAYADAYAFAYLQDAHPEVYAEMLVAMHSLRREPTFATPFYQVEPLYVQLGSRGLDVRLSWHQQVEEVMLESKF
jgi:hypothetical protein